MSFSWAEAITAGVTTVKASHVTELRTNINTLRSLTGLGAYSWVKTITQYVTAVAASEWLELRTALDAAHTANVCSADYLTNNSTYNAAHCLTVYSASNCSSYNFNIQSANYGAFDSSNNWDFFEWE